MEKQDILASIQRHLTSGVISKKDLLVLVGGQLTEENSASPLASSKNIINIFYVIGAIIALVGVVILVGQNWQEIGFVGRILVSLGIAVVTYVAGMLLRNAEQNALSQSMFTIAAFLAPLGVYTLCVEAHITFTWLTQFSTGLGLFVLFGWALWVSKRDILVLFTTFFATWAYYALLLRVLEYSFGGSNNILEWATIFVGLAYICIGNFYAKASTARGKKVVRGMLYGLGTLAILGAGISIGGWFDIVFIAFIFAAFYGSVFLKSRTMLILAALFLIGHIAKLTSKYFSDSLGWSLSLIIIGFVVIGVGYMTLMLNKRFLSKTKMS